MKKYLITGLVTLLPLTVTVLILLFLFNAITFPFVGIVDLLLQRDHLFESSFLVFTAEQVRFFISQVLVLIFLTSFIILLGAVARWFLFRYFLKLWEKLIKYIPVVSSIYKTCQDVIKTIFSSNARSFKQVVMVPFPRAGSYGLGLITCDNLVFDHPNLPEKMVAVFIPTTPNPTSGFVILCQEKELIYLDMKVEDAFKFVISCGVLPVPMEQFYEPRLVEHPMKELFS